MDKLVLLLIILFGNVILWLFRFAGGGLRRMVEHVRQAQSGEVGERGHRREHLPLRQSPMPAAPPPKVVSGTSARAASHTAPLLARFDQIARRIAAVLEQLQQSDGTAGLAQGLEQHLFNACLQARRDLAEQGERGIHQGMREAARLESVLARVDDVIRQRRDPWLGGLLSEVDTLAQALLDPVRANARRLGLELGLMRAMGVVGTQEDVRVEPRLLGTALLPVPVDWSSDVLHWPSLVHALGRCLYTELARLGEEIDQRLLSALDPFADSSELPSPWPRWITGLVGDVFGVLALGAVYLEALAAQLACPDQPMVVQTATRQGAAELMPAHLRVRLGCHVLMLTGAPDAAQRIAAAWRKWHPELSTLLLESDGQWYEVDEALLLAPGQTLVAALVGERWSALNGQSLQALVSNDVATRRSSRAISEAGTQLVSGRPLGAGDAAMLIAAAVTARLAQPKAGPQILDAARRTLTSWGATKERATPPAPGGVLGGPGSDGAIDPVDALVLATLLGPPRSQRWLQEQHIGAQRI